MSPSKNILRISANILRMRMDTTSDEDSELQPYFFRSRDANGLSAPCLITIYVAALGQLSDVTLTIHLLHRLLRRMSPARVQ